jgi:hypothetical protein
MEKKGTVSWKKASMTAYTAGWIFPQKRLTLWVISS